MKGDAGDSPTVRNFSKLVHPDFAYVRYIPDFTLPSLLLKLAGFFFRILGLLSVSEPPATVQAHVEQILVGETGAGGKGTTTTTIPTYVARPAASASVDEHGNKRSKGKAIPGMLWIHGGGMVSESYALDITRIHTYADPNPDCFPDGCVVVAPDYRLAPAHPAPMPGDDCLAAWHWMLSNVIELGIDPSRLIVAGASAGAGLAALVVQWIRDAGDGGPRPALQLLIYPMLDDRTVPRIEGAVKAGSYQTRYPIWNPASNRYGWTSYLGGVDPGLDLPPALEAQVPGRTRDLSGLPRTWIGVGDLDLFHDEGEAYARRLQQAGVEVTLEVVKGAFHAFEMFRSSEVVKRFWDQQVEMLRTV